MRIRNVFLMSICRREQDLGLCTFSVLAYGESLRSGKFREKMCLAAIFFLFSQNLHCAEVPHKQVHKVVLHMQVQLCYPRPHVPETCKRDLDLPIHVPLSLLVCISLFWLSEASCASLPKVHRPSSESALPFD